MRLRIPSNPARIIAAGVLAILTVMAWSAVAHAQAFRSGNNAGVASGETVNSTMFLYGRAVDIAGTVNGDVFCAGQNISVSGTVNGDVLCAGQTVRINGTVNGDVRAAGQTVSLGGTVRDNATLAGQVVTTEGNSTVGGDVSIASEDATLNGSVGRDATIGATNATINGAVKRNVQANVQQLNLGNKANISGRVDYTSHNQVNRANGATVGGEVVRHQPAQQQQQQQAASKAWLFGLWFFVSLLVLALVAVLFFPHVYHRTAEDARSHLGRTFLVGLIGSIVVPVVILLLMFTVIGIPLGILLLLIWLVLLILSGSFAAYLLGRYILRSRTDNAIWTMLLGAAILLIVYFIPFLGQLVALVAMWFGLGMLLWRIIHFPRFRYRMDTAPASEALTPSKGSLKER